MKKILNFECFLLKALGFGGKYLITASFETSMWASLCSLCIGRMGQKLSVVTCFFLLIMYLEIKNKIIPNFECFFFFIKEGHPNYRIFRSHTPGFIPDWTVGRGEQTCWSMSSFGNSVPIAHAYVKHYFDFQIVLRWSLELTTLRQMHSFSFKAYKSSVR